MTDEEKVLRNVENIALALQGIETQLVNITAWLNAQEDHQREERLRSLDEWLGDKKKA